MANPHPLSKAWPALIPGWAFFVDSPNQRRYSSRAARISDDRGRPKRRDILPCLENTLDRIARDPCCKPKGNGLEALCNEQREAKHVKDLSPRVLLLIYGPQHESFMRTRGGVCHFRVDHSEAQPEFPDNAICLSP